MTHELVEFNNDQVDLIKRTVAKGASDDELKLFLYQCKRTGLDPITRQIYAVPRKSWDQNKGAYVQSMTIQTSIDGFRLIAERSGKYAGQLGPYWCGQDGVWCDVWTKTEYPTAARVGVLRSDFKEPLWAVAKWDSYQQGYKDKTGKFNLASMWAKMPDLMLAKVAESLALRRAFPQELSGLYSIEEFPQQNDVDQAKPSLPTYKTTFETKGGTKSIPAVDVKVVSQGGYQPISKNADGSGNLTSPPKSGSGVIKPKPPTSAAEGLPEYRGK